MPNQVVHREGAWIEVDTTTLKANFLAVKNRLAKNSQAPGIIPIVKANAYGHGIVRCSSLYASLGALKLGVAFVSEASLLRKSDDPLLHKTPILVLTPPLQEEAEHICQTNVEIVATDLSVLRRIGKVAEKQKKQICIHIYIDTGMHRDGIPPQDAVKFVKECRTIPYLQISGLCTHFSATDDIDPSPTQKQILSFQMAHRELVNAGVSFSVVHAANSGAILRFDESYFSAVRPGLLLYGYTPIENETSLGTLPALSLKTKVVSLRRVLAGEFIGYGMFYQTPHDTTIATVPIGYGDGISRQLSGKLSVLINQKRYNNVGRICMDQLMIDVGANPIQVGDEVVILGTQGENSIDAYELSKLSNTIPYEILAGLSSRIPRFFVEK